MTEMDELRAEIAALKSQMSALTRAAAPPPEEDEPVSRRGLLGKLAGAAVAGAGLSVLGSSPAEAATGTMVYGTSMNSGTDGTYLSGTTSTQKVFDVTQGGTGIAVGANVTHTTSTQPTLWVRHNGQGSCIDAASLNSDNGSVVIEGWSANGVGVRGTGYNGVQGITQTGVGLHGIAYDDGRGVNGYSNMGDALVGYSNGGYGAWLVGGRAPLRLEPNAGDGPPTTGSHQAGEIVVDSNGTLWVCVLNGTPGTWVRPGFNPLVKRLVSASTATGTYAAAQKKDVTVTGIPAGVTAVALNLTATSTGSGSVTVYPYGTTRPGVAHLAVNPQYRWSGFAVVKLGAGGKLSVYNSAGTTKLSIDLAGFFA